MSVGPRQGLKRHREPAGMATAHGRPETNIYQPDGNSAHSRRAPEGPDEAKYNPSGLKNRALAFTEAPIHSY